MTMEDDSEHSSGQEPVKLGYAGFQDKPSDAPPKPPESALRLARRMMVVSGLAFVGFFFAEDWAFLLSPVVGLFLAFLCLCIASVAVSRNLNERLEESLRTPRRRLWSTFGVAALLLAGQSWAMLQTMRGAREASKTTVTSANLMGIGQAIQIYQKDFGDHPSSLVTLVASNITTSKQMLSICDPDINHYLRPGPMYSSFVYWPGVGKTAWPPDAILGFEREPWSPIGCRLFPTRARWVLFADGHVACLDNEKFEAALKLDKTRRMGMGWPVFQVESATGDRSSR